APLAGARVLGEDVEDQLGAVEHAGVERLLQVALLPRRELVVADHHVELQVAAQRPPLRDLAGAVVERGVRLVAALDLGADHLGAGGAGQLGHLVELRGELLVVGAGQLGGDQEDLLAGGDVYSRSPRSRSHASSTRASGAVTETRKYPSP